MNFIWICVNFLFIVKIQRTPPNTSAINSNRNYIIDFFLVTTTRTLLHKSATSAHLNIYQQVEKFVSVQYNFHYSVVGIWSVLDFIRGQSTEKKILIERHSLRHDNILNDSHVGDRRL